MTVTWKKQSVFSCALIGVEIVVKMKTNGKLSANDLALVFMAANARQFCELASLWTGLPKCGDNINVTKNLSLSK